jgi:hypothetical protein
LAVSYGPYDKFLAVRADGSIIVAGDTPVECAVCGRAHFSWRQAEKCARKILG